MRRLARRIRVLSAEFRRRGVYKAVAAYAVVAWGASLAANELLPTFGAPPWAARAFIVCAALGAPVVALLAWIYELTMTGIVRDANVTADTGQADATLLMAAPSSVCVSWSDAQGTHAHAFDRDFVLGREESCELRLDDPHVSRRHTQARIEQGRWWLVDLASRNGTRMNGRLIRRAPLPHTCVVQLYDAGPQLTFALDQASATITVAAVEDL